MTLNQSKSLFFLLLFIAIIGCEEVVVVDLPESQDLVVVEGWVSDEEKMQQVRLTMSNSFQSEDPNSELADSEVKMFVNSQVYEFIYIGNGYYEMTTPLSAQQNANIFLEIALADGSIVRSGTVRLQPSSPILNSFLRSFVDNDPNNPGEEITYYFPKITALDSAGFRNFYRWRFYKNSQLYTEPESITIQDDKFFDGNFIPNTFEEFKYQLGDTAVVELQVISQSAFDYLSLLKSQINTLGTSSSTTPSEVVGNLDNLNDPGETVLGYFGVISVDRDTLIVTN